MNVPEQRAFRLQIPGCATETDGRSLALGCKDVVEWKSVRLLLGIPTLNDVYVFIFIALGYSLTYSSDLFRAFK